MANRKDSKGRVLRTGESEVPGKGYKYRYTDLSNKRITIYAPDLVQLRQKEKKIQADLQDGIITCDEKITLNYMFDKLMKTKHEIKEDTRYNYVAMWNKHIRPTSYANKPINKLVKSDFLQLYAELHEKLANRSIGFLHLAVHQALQLAVDDNIIRKNPSDDCGKKYATSEKERFALTKEEQKALIECVSQSRYKFYYELIIFLLGTGCRISEALGLTWDDIDFQNNVISVDKQLKYKSRNGHMIMFIDTLKTKGSVRDIPMLPEVKKQLMIQKQTKYFLCANATIQQVDGYSHFVFVSKKGDPICVSSLYDIFQRLSVYVQERYLHSFPLISAHILRHTFCTRAAEAGMDMKVLQKIMGHSSIKMIMKVYNHVDENRAQSEMERIGDIVNL